jgi:hypothetical protein
MTPTNQTPNTDTVTVAAHIAEPLSPHARYRIGDYSRETIRRKRVLMNCIYDALTERMAEALNDGTASWKQSVALDRRWRARMALITDRLDAMFYAAEDIDGEVA